MAESSDKDSKTEEPTEKKIRDTVEKGQLPVSREAPILASFVAVLVFTVFFARESIASFAMFLSTFLEKPEAWSLDTERDVINLYQTVLVEAARMMGAFVILIVIGGILASVMQNPPAFVLDRIRPKASHISLAKGWKRLFGAKGWVEFGKQVFKLVLAIAVLSFAVGEARNRLLAGMITNPVVFGGVIRDVMIDILIAITLVMAAVAIFDLVWSRFSWRQDLRMTKQEVKDEHKQSEGDPIVKMRLRSLARNRARQRMMTAVPRATLIVANPTHFSIALKYVREEDSAPMVVAKGQDLVALKIREIAAEHGIPVFEDVALARSMYKQVSVDKAIPHQFYQAVAELVRIVYSKKAQPTAGRVRP
ncbi:MAG: flagellar biosynthesis protein FlhB [Rhizobiaceae bacterium]